MFIYYLILICSALGICIIFIRKKYGAGYFHVRFSKRYFGTAAARQKIPIENSASAAMHCPAITLADESSKPQLNKTNKKDLKNAMEKAEAAKKRGDADSAEKNYVKVLSFDENNIEANLNLGLIYLKKGYAAKAEAIYKKLIELKCADAVIYSNLGNSLYQQQKLNDACEAYTKAADLDPQNPRRFMNLGKVLHEMGNFDGAIENINRAISLDNNAEYSATLADVYISLGNFSRAQELIDQAFKIDKKNPAVRIVSKKLKTRKKRE